MHNAANLERCGRVVILGLREPMRRREFITLLARADEVIE